MAEEGYDYWYGCRDDCGYCEGVGTIKANIMFGVKNPCPNNKWLCRHCDDDRTFDSRDAVKTHIVMAHPEVD